MNRTRHNETIASRMFENRQATLISAIKQELMDLDEQTYQRLVESAKVQTITQDNDEEHIAFYDKKKHQFIMFPLEEFLYTLERVRNWNYFEKDKKEILFIKRLIEWLVWFEASEYIELKKIIDRELVYIYKLINENGKALIKEMNREQTRSLYSIKKDIRKYLWWKIWIFIKNREFQKELAWEYEETPWVAPISTLNDRLANIMLSIKKLSAISPDRNKEEVLSFLIKMHLLNIWYIKIKKKK